MAVWRGTLDSDQDQSQNHLRQLREPVPRPGERKEKVWSECLMSWDVSMLSGTFGTLNFLTRQLQFVHCAEYLPIDKPTSYLPYPHPAITYLSSFLRGPVPSGGPAPDWIRRAGAVFQLSLFPSCSILHLRCTCLSNGRGCPFPPIYQILTGTLPSQVNGRSWATKLSKGWVNFEVGWSVEIPCRSNEIKLYTTHLRSTLYAVFAYLMTWNTTHVHMYLYLVTIHTDINTKQDKAASSDQYYTLYGTYMCFVTFAASFYCNDVTARAEMDIGLSMANRYKVRIRPTDPNKQEAKPPKVQSSNRASVDRCTPYSMKHCLTSNLHSCGTTKGCLGYLERYLYIVERITAAPIHTTYTSRLSKSTYNVHRKLHAIMTSIRSKRAQLLRQEQNQDPSMLQQLISGPSPEFRRSTESAATQHEGSRQLKPCNHPTLAPHLGEGEFSTNDTMGQPSLASDYPSRASTYNVHHILLVSESVFLPSMASFRQQQGINSRYVQRTCRDPYFIGPTTLQQILFRTGHSILSYVTLGRKSTTHRLRDDATRASVAQRHCLQPIKRSNATPKSKPRVFIAQYAMDGGIMTEASSRDDRSPFDSINRMTDSSQRMEPSPYYSLPPIDQILKDRTRQLYYTTLLDRLEETQFLIESFRTTYFPWEINVDFTSRWLTGLKSLRGLRALMYASLHGMTPHIGYFIDIQCTTYIHTQPETSISHSNFAIQRTTYLRCRKRPALSATKNLRHNPPFHRTPTAARSPVLSDRSDGQNASQFFECYLGQRRIPLIHWGHGMATWEADILEKKSDLGYRHKRLGLGRTNLLAACYYDLIAISANNRTSYCLLGTERTPNIPHNVGAHEMVQQINGVQRLPNDYPSPPETCHLQRYSVRHLISAAFPFPFYQQTYLQAKNRMNWPSVTFRTPVGISDTLSFTEDNRRRAKYYLASQRKLRKQLLHVVPPRHPLSFVDHIRPAVSATKRDRLHPSRLVFDIGTTNSRWLLPLSLVSEITLTTRDGLVPCSTQYVKSDTNIYIVYISAHISITKNLEPQSVRVFIGIEVFFQLPSDYILLRILSSFPTALVKSWIVVVSSPVQQLHSFLVPEGS
ncbi:hypothetical protein ACRALDRAFT_212782 [Sodiomyces alcalophilus JCM 7366]|uniref:uncharacterized protein n=1 Tax=Sodiomyces alcalophilus JCM 7366 TaxID=591952 RepID=UPI0039B40231